MSVLIPEARELLESDAPPGFDAPGYVLRITPERLGGVGPWAGRS